MHSLLSSMIAPFSGHLQCLYLALIAHSPPRHALQVQNSRTNFVPSALDTIVRKVQEYSCSDGEYLCMWRQGQSCERKAWVIFICQCFMMMDLDCILRFRLAWQQRNLGNAAFRVICRQSQAADFWMATQVAASLSTGVHLILSYAPSHITATFISR